MSSSLLSCKNQVLDHPSDSFSAEIARDCILSTGMAKKFFWVFPYNVTEKLFWANGLANPLEGTMV